MSSLYPQNPKGPGALRWGIKRSFVSYLSRLPDCRVSAEDGASIVSGSYFQFVRDTAAEADAAGAPEVADVLKFRGVARLSGHHGMLSVVVADPWVEFTSGGAVLSVVEPRAEPGSAARLELLRLAVPAGVGSSEPGSAAPEQSGTDWMELPAGLAPAAVELFNAQYAAGEEMDPLFLGPAVSE
jgi:hypothetical protein